MVFDRFTSGARQVVVLAQESARRRGSDRIESSDLLGGILLLPGDEPATRVLRAARLRAETLHVAGPPGPAGNIPFTDEAKQSLLDTLRASLAAGHNVIAPLHLLLGVLAAPDGQARRTLRANGVDADRVAEQARTTLATTDLPAAAGPTSLPDQGPPAGALPRRGTVTRTLAVLLLAYAACAFVGIRIGQGILGEAPLIAAAVAAPPVSVALGTLRTQRAFDRMAERRRAAPTQPATLPPELPLLLADYGMTEVHLYREGQKVRSRCSRAGHRAYIVIAQAHLARPKALAFVSRHEVSHLLRNDPRIRRVAATLLVTLIWLAPASGSLAAAGVLVGGGLLLWTATCWISELACDAKALRWAGHDAATDWIRLHRALHHDDPSPRARLRRTTLGWLTHPPLALRAALLRV
ncbi:Clp protease N-terminal domain-containing protein [Streptacidiphilus jiangxiensis]|nr:Clp protease N-terminal domain-containing protein [Streptacidiphilus jiangxiensis]